MKRAASTKAVIISGLTAAGKTTHARLLAKTLGWQYIGTSQLRQKLLSSVPVAEGKEWAIELDIERSGSEHYDRALDQIICQHVARSDQPLVVDAWLQPWLSNSVPSVRVWLESDAASRLKKAKVYCLRAGTLPDSHLAQTIQMKDEFSRHIFRRLYGIEFKHDDSVFDMRIDNSAYITKSTIESSNRGIREFRPMFESLIQEKIVRRMGA